VCVCVCVCVCVIMITITNFLHVYGQKCLLKVTKTWGFNRQKIANIPKIYQLG
jgi:hypothetical protein